MKDDVILTGLRSNGEFHLGNYLGAIQPMVDIQRTHKDAKRINMFVPDLHSFTTPIDHSNLYNQTIENIKTYAVAGLNLETPNTFVYRQSYISAHSELAWILSCFTYVGELSRMTQYKEKSTDNTTSGLFNYPVLMAADILLYGAQWIPVGEDQRQHIELARDLALRFNNKFGNIFVIPNDWKHQLDFIKLGRGLRVRSLRNPEKKMSKSVDDPAGTILLSDSPDNAAKKILSATTDSLQSINLDWQKQPGISNLLQILACLQERPIDDVATNWSGKTSYGDLKKQVAEVVSSFLVRFQSDYKKINNETILAKLISDEAEIKKIADSKLLEVQVAVGLRPKSE